MKRILPLIADNGLIAVLVVLTVSFSVATWTEQPLTGRAAGEALARLALRDFAGKSIAVVATTHAEDAEFLDAIEMRLKEAGADFETIRGGPVDALRRLGARHRDGPNVDLIVGSHATAGWSFLLDASTQFPNWPAAVYRQAPSYSWPTFLLADNLRNIISQIAVIAIVAIGMTFVIATGGIDLSVGALMGFSAIVATLLMERCFGGKEATIGAQVVCCAAALAGCAALGLATGLLITRYDLPPFIASLGMMWISRGLAWKLSKGSTIAEVPPSFAVLGQGATIAGIPNLVALMFALFALAYVLMTRSVLGRCILAVGSNRRAATLSGLPVNRVLLFVYVLSAILAGLGGIALASRLQSGDPKFGQEYELYVITAVVVGGTSLSGGQGRIHGTLLGALLISVTQVGMNLVHVDPFSQMIVLGVILLTAVLIDRWKRQ